MPSERFLTARHGATIPLCPKAANSIRRRGSWAFLRLAIGRRPVFRFGAAAVSWLQSLIQDLAGLFVLALIITLALIWWGGAP